MTAQELIVQLQQQNPKADVILASDDEGNSFHVINSVEADNMIIVIWPSSEYMEV